MPRLVALLLLSLLLSAGSVRAGEGPPPENVPPELRGSYDKLSSTAEGLEPRVLALGLRAFGHARAHQQVQRNRLTIIDFSLPSTARRLWVMDLDSDEILFHEWVAHGKHTGANHAKHFSNEVGSYRSSLGTFLTAETYIGKHGTSLRLLGLEPGINDRALERLIVMHGAAYVSEEFLRKHGRLGRSWGCPALREVIAVDVIEAIRGGSVLFAYYPDPGFLERSTFLE